ncbi:hypothetical protein K443DRAFT_317680 [Laccaria amethystina LaAM-08-1]|jgi:hypothetical protein|uniref:Unplaced genomic scaffold K443scaffold_21, whole genome shotgun sequence n=1 Tax=Laccaria amethystina LaAM-08-1 TaxID=1095629 RepID=A0A0C9X1C5_9AGAR|nr:hypothetical protein K443DRAFT_317680 [Laccaria amethystina LaAM-08-1]
MSNACYSQSCPPSPAVPRLSALFPRGGQYMVYSFACRGPSPNRREESDTRTEGEETIKSPHQTRLLPYSPLLTPVHTAPGSRSPSVPTGAPFVSTVSLILSTCMGLPFASTHSRSPFASTSTGPPFAQALARIHGSLLFFRLSPVAY